MANFQTHITTSTLVGIGYGATGYAAGVNPASCMVAAGLCSVAGMLPDLDSDSGVPLRETVNFVAAGVPLLLLDRFAYLGLTTEQMVLAGGLVYIFIRFVVAEIFRRYTVHRGMWHSIPAAASVGLLTFILCNGCDWDCRLLKTGGVVLGFLTHLVLDEIYSFEVRRGRFRIKKSLGTALKFWSKKRLWANVSTYAKLLLFLVLALGDPMVVQHLPESKTGVPRQARKLLDNVFESHTHDQQEGVWR